MSDDGRLPPAWGPAPPPVPPVPPGPAGPPPVDGGLAGLFDQPPPNPWTQVPAPPDPAQLAAQHQAALEASAAAAAASAADPTGPGDEDPNRGGPAHRARRRPARYLIPAMGAVAVAIVVLALGVGISGWFGRTDDTLANPGVSHSLSSQTTPTTVSTPPVSPTSSASTPTSPAPSKTPPSPPPTKTQPVPVAPPVVHAPSVVLNETTSRGLAARVAAVLRSKGWVVTGVGNWRGEISTTTVYYPPGMEAAARSLAYDLGVSRLRPSVGGMLTNRLTVVLTANPF